MSNKHWFALLLCRFKLHVWQIELRGHTYQGSVYPIRFRVCQRCNRIEQEVFDDATQSTSWVKVDKLQNANIE